jgi:hypothetical protein
VSVPLQEMMAALTPPDLLIVLQNFSWADWVAFKRITHEKGRLTRPFDRYPAMASGSHGLDLGGQATFMTCGFVLVKNTFVSHRINDLLSHFEKISGFGFVASDNSFLNVFNNGAKTGAQGRVGCVDFGILANALETRGNANSFFLDSSHADNSKRVNETSDYNRYLRSCYFWGLKMNPTYNQALKNFCNPSR